jgi:hypothetical protein
MAVRARYAMVNSRFMTASTCKYAEKFFETGLDEVVYLLHLTFPVTDIV